MPWTSPTTAKRVPTRRRPSTTTPRLDLMLPQLPGLDVLRKIRAHKPSLPVLILTARGSVEDKVAELDSGASDYLVKPFAFAELSARIRALLRRGAQEATTLRLADLEMNTATRSVARST